MNLKARWQRIYDKVAVYGIEDQFINLGSLQGPKIPDWLAGETIYEVYVRAFSREGTFEGVRKRLAEIRDFGFNVLWFMPIFPIGQVERKGKLGSPYAVRDYYNVNPEYGTNEHFRNLVQEAHQMGMRVIIDMVPDHVAFDYNKLAEQPALIKRDAEGKPFRRVTEWTDIIELNYEVEATRRHVLDIMKHWIREYDIDGYRVDVAGMVPVEYWEWVMPQLHAIKKDLFFLAEWESPSLHKTAFHSNYDWTLYALMKLVYQGKEPARILSDWLKLRPEIYPIQNLPLRFVENHDKPRAVSVFKGEALPAFLTFIFTLNGAPLMYNGQETGARRAPSLFEKETIHWEEVNTGLMGIYKKLIQLRKEIKAMASAEYTFYEQADAADVLAYEKNGSEQLLVIINFGKKEYLLRPDQELYQRLKKSNPVFNTHDVYVQTRGTIQLSPHQAIILM